MILTKTDNNTLESLDNLQKNKKEIDDIIKNEMTKLYKSIKNYSEEFNKYQSSFYVGFFIIKGEYRSCNGIFATKNTMKKYKLTTNAILEVYYDTSSFYDNIEVLIDMKNKIIQFLDYKKDEICKANIEKTEFCNIMGWR